MSEALPEVRGRLLVIGATGATGQLVVENALRAGYQVTALSRHPDRLTRNHPNLQRIAADVTANGEALSNALAGQDYVVSALGRGHKLSSDHLMERAAAKLVPAMQKTGPARLVYLSAYGVGDTIEGA